MSTPELDQHKARLARMGMIYTDPYGPTDMNQPKVKERMEQVAKSATDTPSTFNLLNDFDLGNQVRMLMRNDSAHEAVVCAARDRIFQLSLEVARLRGLSLFLVERLDDFERDPLQSDDGEYTLRQFAGHVSPAIERLRRAISKAEPSND